MKTLKDLQKSKGNCDSYEIRQEAIKWVDEIRMDAMGFILVFFNITEEDLKKEVEDES